MSGPMRANGFGWSHIAPVKGIGAVAHLWYHEPSATQVLSSLDMAELPRSGGIGPQWHLSIVDRHDEAPARPSEAQVALARCAFGMLNAEEDNHHPGAARHFWMPVDPSERVDCECKAEEVNIEDGDGYRWTNPRDGSCRGCEFERAMRALGQRRPCPIHVSTQQASLDTKGET